MAPRANWKGYLKLSLVSCAVALYPASRSSARIGFHTLSRTTGNRLRRQMVDPQTGQAVDPEDQAKGYEVTKDEYVVVEDEELDAISIESTHTIDIESFVPRSEIDEVYLDSPFYLAPDDTVAQEPFAVIREAMRRHDVVGLGRIVLFRRERIVMLEPRGNGMFVATLRYPYEVRDDQAYFQDIAEMRLQPEMLDIASEIIDRMAGHFRPASFHDRYEEALLELIRSKQTGRPVALPPPPAPPSVTSLMDALRRSLAAEQQAARPGHAPAGAPGTAGWEEGSRTPAAKSRPAGRRSTAGSRKPARRVG